MALRTPQQESSIVNLGQINFGPTAETSFLRSQVAAQAADIRDLEAEVAQLIAQRNQLRAVLQKCAALTPAVSDAKHEALLATDPKNIYATTKKPLP
jgi:hypothetical protein